MASKTTPFGLRMPDDVKAWIAEQAKRNRGSQNSEIVRSVRERMDREAQTKTAG